MWDVFFIATFGDDLRQMAQKAYSNLDTRAQEVLALNQLYKNISLEMKCRCIDKECHSVTEAVDLVERYEALLSPNVAMDSLGCLVLVSNLESHLFWCLALPNLCSRVFISR
jgi:hypothetical protein